MLLLLPVLFILERFYFSLSDRLQIIDKPNSRSSHSHITRRGGGIIFPVAWLLFFAISGFSMPWLSLGMVLIAIVSFRDDLGEVAVFPRIATHAVALFLLLHQFGVTGQLPVWGLALAVFCGIAVLNAVNFMDGINGMLALYGLVFWGMLAFASETNWNSLLFDFTSPFNYIIASLIVFAFFNCRKNAVCFAGDVGSVTLAYLMIGALTPMMFGTSSGGWMPDLSNDSSAVEMKFMLLLAVFGVDSVLTILHRLMLRENIFKGHRRHLYQVMANEAKMPHLAVSMIYASIQLVISIWVITSEIDWTKGLTLLLVLSSMYIGTKWYFVSPARTRKSVAHGLDSDIVHVGGVAVADVPVLAADFNEAEIIPQSTLDAPENSAGLPAKDSNETVRAAEMS